MRLPQIGEETAHDGGSEVIEFRREVGFVLKHQMSRFTN
jgi:hypothetical protein